MNIFLPWLSFLLKLLSFPTANIVMAEPLSPTTKYVGERLSLECYITGAPRPTYTWYRDGRILDPNHSRINIKVIDYGSR